MIEGLGFNIGEEFFLFSGEVSHLPGVSFEEGLRVHLREDASTFSKWLPFFPGGNSHLQGEGSHFYYKAGKFA